MCDISTCAVDLKTLLVSAQANCHVQQKQQKRKTRSFHLPKKCAGSKTIDIDNRAQLLRLILIRDIRNHNSLPLNYKTSEMKTFVLVTAATNTRCISDVITLCILINFRFCTSPEFPISFRQSRRALCRSSTRIGHEFLIAHPTPD